MLVQARQRFLGVTLTRGLFPAMLVCSYLEINGYCGLKEGIVKPACVPLLNCDAH